MLYMDFIQKAKELTIEQNDNGTWYLIPEWRYVLASNELALYKFRDFRADWYAIEDNLKLEVEKRNKAWDKTPRVMSWAYDLINASVEPAMTAEENELVANAISFMKMSHEAQANETKEDDEQKEEAAKDE